MDKNLDGWRKNLAVVIEGFEEAKKEWKDTVPKLKEAFESKDYKDFFHHLSDFRGAGTEHLWRLHFYLFWPKWAIVALLIWNYN